MILECICPFRRHRRLSQAGGNSHSLKAPPRHEPGSDLTIHYAQDVAVRIFEPRHLDIAGDVHVALAPRLRQIVALELDALAVKRADDTIDVIHRPAFRSM